MRKFLTSAVSSAIFHSAKLARNGWVKGLRILTYHRISDARGDRLSVSPAEFAKQMEWLGNHGYVGVNVKEGLEQLRSRGVSPRGLRGKMPLGRAAVGRLVRRYRAVGAVPRLRTCDGRIPIALTFDDGYLDNYTNAFPVLKKYGFSATVYVITGLVGKKENDQVFLSWKEISEMHRGGIEIGSHTVTHPRLTSVDLEKAKEEIKLSKLEIETKLNVIARSSEGAPRRPRGAAAPSARPALERAATKQSQNRTEIASPPTGARNDRYVCESFCYPGGMWNKKLAGCVREAGYGNATTVMPGENNPGSDPFLLKRTEVSGEDSLFEFEKKISGAYDLLHQIWQSAGMLR